ncbi:MAG: DNA helicase PcrA [Lachnospiraceae bacterium]|jgi:DNA helicase-2/ATP-dependent DNA helicase PcrA|nr:DNA helicase PcrA [Lachnospiraceae bacterium]
MANIDMLNEMQRKAVLKTEGPVLILAGAGSGKTRVITNRIAYLIEECGVNPWNIMAITFTNKAAGEMRERVDDMVGFGSESIWVSTFHSTCVKILRRYIDRIGYDNSFTIYDTDDQKSVMKDICKRLQIDTKNLKEKTILGYISSAKNEMVSPQSYMKMNQSDYHMSKVAQAYVEYQETLKKNNALDFDDLLVLTVELFKNCPDVLDYYQERFKYIMVDEYQDTNTVQFELISLLAEKYKNLCVVGDDDQSIYKFRGANIRNILDFERVFPDTAVIKLEQNYRSTGNILDAANEVIKNNRGRKDKKLWTDKEDGELISLKTFDNGFMEAEFIAKDIRDGVEAGEVTYNDCACLYRTNAQSRLIEEKLIQNNIPYKLIGGVNFYQRKEVKDMLAYLKTIDNGRDDVAVKRIINIPKRGIGATTLGRVEEYALSNNLSFFEALMDCERIPGLGKAVSKINEFVNFIRVQRSKLGYNSLKEILESIMKDTGYIEELKTENTEESLARIENVEELLTKIVTYEESTDEPTLAGFLEEVALIADIDSLENSSDYVVLMTIHSAKGLEFPRVYLSGMEDGVFPSYMCLNSDDPTDIEEERRLCYVAITRAMKKLTISCARARMLRGETQYNKMSRFVGEIPGYLLDKGATTGKTSVGAGSFGGFGSSGGFSSGVKTGSSYTTSGRGMSAADLFRTSAFDKPKTSIMSKPAFGSSLSSKPATLSKGSEISKADGLDYGVSDRVKHIKFGVGTVTAINDSGRDYEVTVNFDTAGPKKMFASFAKLKKI